MITLENILIGVGFLLTLAICLLEIKEFIEERRLKRRREEILEQMFKARMREFFGENWRAK